MIRHFFLHEIDLLTDFSLMSRLIILFLHETIQLLQLTY
jgi:hypothetical protein